MSNRTVPGEYETGEYETGLSELRRDCVRMASRWGGPVPYVAGPAPVSPSLIRGVTVPPGTARLVDGMSEYGD
jgi:hypothetical protein